MKTIKIIITSLMALGMVFLLHSCTEDKGTYSYTDIIEITLPELAESYTRQQLDLLEIKPEWSFPQERKLSDFKFEWQLLKTDISDALVDTIGREPELSFICDLPLGNYDLRCFVTDKIDGRIYVTGTILYVANIRATGMMVLSDVNGNAEVSFISTFGDVTVNAYYERNGEHAGRNPLSITSSGPNRSNAEANMAKHEHTVFILCDDEKGGVLCDPLLFTHIFDIDEMFVIKPEVIKPKYLFTPSAGAMEFLVYNGKVCKRDLDRSGHAYPLFELPADADFETDLSPYFFYNNSPCVGYCNLQECFVEVSRWTLSMTRFSSAAWGDTSGKKMVWAFLLDQKYAWVNQEYRALLEDGSGNKTLYAGVLSVYDFTGSYSRDLRAFPELNSASTYTLSANGAILLAAKGNTIYTYGIEADQMFNTAELPLQAGESIDLIELDQYSGNIYVGVSDGSRSSGSGSVYIYSLNTSNGDLTLVETYQNIAGKIVDFEWKKM